MGLTGPRRQIPPNPLGLGLTLWASRLRNLLMARLHVAGVRQFLVIYRCLDKGWGD